MQGAKDSSLGTPMVMVSEQEGKQLQMIFWLRWNKARAGPPNGMTVDEIVVSHAKAFSRLLVSLSIQAWSVLSMTWASHQFTAQQWIGMNLPLHLPLANLFTTFPADVSGHSSFPSQFCRIVQSLAHLFVLVQMAPWVSLRSMWGSWTWVQVDLMVSPNAHHISVPVAVFIQLDVLKCAKQPIMGDSSEFNHSIYHWFHPPHGSQNCTSYYLSWE